MVNPKDYVVLDVETNGLNAKEDDLLSISIYKPDTGEMYDRFLPLEKQAELNPEAVAVNGITMRHLRHKKPLNQAELDSIIEEFELDRRTVLAYGGRRFDERFVRQYLEDHGLTGFENVVFFDFKQMIHSSGDRFFPASKDNLCRAFGIPGVESIHTSANDCRLEWELFRAMDGHHVLVTGPNVFRLRPGYIYPASYLDGYSRLQKYAGVKKRYVAAEEVFRLELSEKDSAALVKYPNNITGLAVEHLIDAGLHAVEIDSREFLTANKGRLDFVGSFEGSAEIVGVSLTDDGGVNLSPSTFDELISRLSTSPFNRPLVKVLRIAKRKGGFVRLLERSKKAYQRFVWICDSSPDPEVREMLLKVYWQSQLVDAVSETNIALGPALDPLVKYLSGILGRRVMSQELVVNEDDGCLALCDLSSDKAVVEIKTGSSGYDPAKIVNQLYYTAAGRDCYLLHIDWEDCRYWREDRYPKTTSFIVERIAFLDKNPKRKREASGE